MASNSRSTAKNRVNNDPVDELKRRSRRRLVGAIALFLAAIVIVPALVETEPVQTPSKVELIVPDRPSADITPAIEGASAKQADKPVASATSQPDTLPTTPAAAPAPVEPAVQPSKAVSEPIPPKPAVEPKPLAAKKPEVAKPEPSKPDVKKPEAQKTEDDLIAKFAKEDQETFWVQVAAVGDKARADTLRKELGAKGFSSKVEPVASNGATVYRVRVGPYTGQDKADAAKSQLGTAGYTGRVVQ